MKEGDIVYFLYNGKYYKGEFNFITNIGLIAIRYNIVENINSPGYGNVIFTSILKSKEDVLTEEEYFILKSKEIDDKINKIVE